MNDRSEFMAFAVTEPNEATGGIIFAKHAIVARRLGANEYNGGEFGGLSVRRAKWADRCAETGIVPAALMVDHGWHFECSGCGRRIDEDLPSLWENEVDVGEKLAGQQLRYARWRPRHVIGHQHSAVFCDNGCKTAHEAFEAERTRRQDHAIAVFKAKVRARFPDAEFVENGYSRQHAFVTKSNGRWRVEQVIVAFNFPGMKHGPASLRWDQPYRWRNAEKRKAEKAHYTCCTGDLAAFEAWAKSAVPEKVMAPA